MICRRCKGKGWYWVQNGEDDVDREPCDCQEGDRTMNNLTCQKAIHLTDWFHGKAGKRKCGKLAVTFYSGLPMCQHHVNKIMKKLERNNIQTKSKEMMCECGKEMEFIGTEWICKDCR